MATLKSAQRSIDRSSALLKKAHLYSPAEARNILEARKWIYSRNRKFTTSKILTLSWITQLHKEAQHQKMIEAIKECDLGNFKAFMEFATH